MKPLEIFIIEDNPGDVRLIEECLRKSKVLTRISASDDGVQAMEFLSRQGPFTKAPRPDLILLDLNLPRKDGREVLAEIKRDVNLRRIPIVVLTSSDAEADIIRAYDLHANCYITKPIIFEDFIRVVNAIEMFWLSVVKLPGRG